MKACSEYVGSCLEMMRYAEVNAIISKVQDVAWKTYAWSRAMLIEVPENMANSDHPGKKKRLAKSEFELHPIANVAIGV